MDQKDLEIEVTPVWYLAHPVSPDDRFSYVENLEHVNKVAKVIWLAGVRTMAPWYHQLHFLEDSNTQHREESLEADCYVAAALGRIILVGHQISEGMELEKRAVEAVGGKVIDWTGLSTTFIRQEAIVLASKPKLRFMAVLSAINAR